MRKPIIVAAALSILCACDRAPSPAPTSNTTPGSELPEPKDPAFVGKVWISTTLGKPLGSMLIFMPDRTLVMDSCFETYRLSKWGVAGERIRWLEEGSTIPIEASVDMPRPNTLILRIAGQDQDQSFVTATVPYVCPDMPK